MAEARHHHEQEPRESTLTEAVKKLADRVGHPLDVIAKHIANLKGGGEGGLPDQGGLGKGDYQGGAEGGGHHHGERLDVYSKAISDKREENKSKDVPSQNKPRLI